MVRAWRKGRISSARSDQCIERRRQQWTGVLTLQHASRRSSPWQRLAWVRPASCVLMLMLYVSSLHSRLFRHNFTQSCIMLQTITHLHVRTRSNVERKLSRMTIHNVDTTDGAG